MTKQLDPILLITAETLAEIVVEADRDTNPTFVFIEAQGLAARSGKMVRLRFDGVEVETRTDQPAFMLACRYYRARSIAKLAQEDAPTAEELRARDQRVIHQLQVDQLMQAFPRATADLPRLIHWLHRFVSASDCRGVCFDQEVIASRLEASGLAEPRGEGSDPQDELGQLIVARAVSLLRHGGRIQELASDIQRYTTARR